MIISICKRFIFCYLILLSGCGENIAKIDNSSKIKANPPSEELQKFVAEIEKAGWISDTSRINSTGIYQELNDSNIRLFKNHPFYFIEFENSHIYQAYQGDMNDKTALNHLKKVKTIWGYFYRDKDATDWITDGIIEQWEFETNDQAEKALNIIRPNGSYIFFNTHPYFCRIKNYMIIFHTRAMAFSYDQKPLFEKFVRDNSLKEN